MDNEKDLAIIKRRLRGYAKELGLPIFGVASPEPIGSLVELLARRRQQGLESHFEKRWNPEARCRPDNILASVKSIICVGMPYYSTPGETSSLWGIARFARGRDYHIVLKDKLELLAVFLGSLTGPDFEYRTAVDSVPLVERALAYRAGLGWYGKNNLLINPDYGSWFVLGELFTNVSLEPDAPLDAHCGSCELCLKACPTGALIAPYQLDSRKCVSCITQKKGEVPVPLREKVSQTLLGCDVCQEVCPRNKAASACRNNGAEGAESLQGKDFPGDDLAALLHFTGPEFTERYGETGFAWAKDLIQRNAVLALGCHGGAKYLSVLEDVLESGSPQVRAHAAWALAQIRGQKGEELLENGLPQKSGKQVDIGGYGRNLG